MSEENKPENSVPHKRRVHKKHNDEHAEADHPVEEGTWLISYADLMTCLCVFFILMFVLNSQKKGTAKSTLENIAAAINGEKPKPSEEQVQLDGLMKDVAGMLGLQGMTKITRIEDGLKITFESTHLFESNQARIKPEIIDTLDILIDIIRQRDERLFVVAEGHTDGSKIGSGKFESNWELSSARAASVIQRFNKSGFKPEHLAAVGYGDTQPLVPNFDENNKPILENMSINRRVIIKVYLEEEYVNKNRLGLGLFFKGDNAYPEKVEQNKPVPATPVKSN